MAMIGRATKGETNGLPCFDLLIGWLLWGMRNSGAERGEEPLAEVVPLAPRNLH
jgi:hypothetical protein